MPLFRKGKRESRGWTLSGSPLRQILLLAVIILGVFAPQVFMVLRTRADDVAPQQSGRPSGHEQAGIEAKNEHLASSEKSTDRNVKRVRIVGRITARLTGSPVVGAEVELSAPGRQAEFATRTTKTDQDGRYVFESVAKVDSPILQKLVVVVTAEGYGTAERRFIHLKIPKGATEIQCDLSVMPSVLNDVVDIFSCCILNWSAVTTMLPAFLLGGAIITFIPGTFLIQYLGKDAPKHVSYAVAAGSGVVLSLCSCNVVPLFVSIYRRGAGIGPAFTFLYAGPAINLVSLFFVIKVVGPAIGIWRAILVPVIAIIIGMSMAFIFRKEEVKRLESTPAAKIAIATTHSPKQLVVFFALLLAIVICGAANMPRKVMLFSMGLMICVLVPLSVKWFEKYEIKQWLLESWRLLKLVVPILIPSVFLIAIVAQHTPISWVSFLVDNNSIGVNFLAATFGSLMYFPILTEVAFVKAFLKLWDMGIGPAMAILLTGPGLSLPGTILVGRAIGFKKVIVYVILLIILTALMGAFFGSSFGQYICSCKTMD